MSRALHRPRCLLALSVLLAALSVGGPAHAADPGRLFYTPAERAQLEAARAGRSSPTRPAGRAVAASAATPPPLRYDGVVVRSDGAGTRWVNGRAQVGSAAVAGLKPGQIRADGRVYEPYQVLRSGPAETAGEVTER